MSKYARFPKALKEKYKVEPPACWVDEDGNFYACFYGKLREGAAEWNVENMEDAMALIYSQFLLGAT